MNVALVADNINDPSSTTIQPASILWPDESRAARVAFRLQRPALCLSVRPSEQPNRVAIRVRRDKLLETFRIAARSGHRRTGVQETRRDHFQILDLESKAPARTGLASSFPSQEGQASFPCFKERIAVIHGSNKHFQSERLAIPLNCARPLVGAQLDAVESGPLITFVGDAHASASRDS